MRDKTTTGTNSTSVASTSSTSTASLTSRRTLFINRRRPGVTTLSPTTTEPLPNEPSVKTTTMSPTAFIESEEVLQEIGEIDYLEDSTQITTDLPRTTEYAQRRRPLVQLQIKTEDQNLAATTEEEKKRQSKKYSSSFKQNELNEIIRQRTSGEVVDIVKEGKANTESYSSETAAAVALAAHQLITAPVPVITDYEEDAKTTNEPFKYTMAYTITQQSEDLLKTPAYSTSRKYYDPTSNTYSSVELEKLSTSTYSTDNTNARSQQRYTTIGAFTGRVSTSQDEIDLSSTAPTYATDTTATKTSRRLTTGRYRGRLSTSTTDSDVISTIQPSTYEPVTDKRGQIKFNGEFVDSFAGFGFGASKTTGEQGSGKFASGVSRGSVSRHRITADAPVTTDSTYEARTTDIRGPEKYKSSVSTFETNLDVQSNADVQSNLGVQTVTDERGSGKYSAGKYQGSVSTYETNVDIQSNDEQGSGKYSTRLNRFRISADAPVTTDSTYEARITDIRGPAKYSAGEYQGSVPTFLTNVDVQSNADSQSNANIQYNVVAQTNTGEWFNKDALSNVNFEYNASAKSIAGVQSVDSTKIKTTDIRGSDKYSARKYEGSVSTQAQSNVNVQYNVGAQSNTGERAHTDALSNVIQYNAGTQSNADVQSVSSAELKTTSIRGSEKYSTGIYHGSVSTFETNIDEQSNARVQSNANMQYKEDAQSNLNIENNESEQSKVGVQSVISTEKKTTDIRGSEKYSAGKYQGLVSTSETNVDVQFNAGAQSNINIQSNEAAQSNIGERVNTDALSNINIQYNAGTQSNAGVQSVSTAEENTSDIRGSEKYSAGQYQGLVSTSETNANGNTQSNVNIQNNAGAQYNAGVQSVTSTEVKTTDIRSSEKYSTENYQGLDSPIESNINVKLKVDGQTVNYEQGKYSRRVNRFRITTDAPITTTDATYESRTTDIRGLEKYKSSVSTSETNVDVQFNAGAQSNANIQSNVAAQSNTGERVNTDALSNINVQYNAGTQSNSGVQSVSTAEENTTDIRGSEKYSAGQYQGLVSTSDTTANGNTQSNVNIQYNAGAQYNAGVQSVTSTEVKTTDIRGSEKYSTENYQGLDSPIESNINVKLKVEGQTVNNEQGLGKYSRRVNKFRITTDAPITTTDATYEARTTDIRGLEKYKSSVSTSETNVDVQFNAGAQSNANIQSNEAAQSNTGERVNKDVLSNINIQYNAGTQSNAGVKSVSTAEENTTDIRGSDKYSAGQYQSLVSTSETNANGNTQSNVNIQYNAGAQFNAGVQSVTSTEVKSTDIRGSEKYSTENYQGLVSPIESNINVKSKVGGQTVNYEQGKYSRRVNRFRITTDTPITTTDATYEARTTDIRGLETYKSSVSTSETNVDVQFNAGAQSNANIQSNVAAQSNTGERVNTDALSNINIQYNAGTQSNSGVQSVSTAGENTTDIRGSDKYSAGQYQGLVSTSDTTANGNTQSNVNIQYNAGVQSVTSTEVKTTDIRGSEKYSTENYQGLDSPIESNINVKSKVEGQTVNNEQGLGKYSSRVNRFRITTDAPITTTDAAYEARTTDIRGLEKYKSLVSTFETNADIYTYAGVQPILELQTDERGSEKYSGGKYQGSFATSGANVDAQSNVGAQFNASIQSVPSTWSDKYSTGKNQGSVTTSETNVQSNAGQQSIANEQYNVGVQSNTSEWVNTDALSNVNIQYNAGAQSNAGVESVTSTNVKTTELRGSEKYFTGQHQDSDSAFENNVDVQSNVRIQTVNYERGSGKYSIGVNRYRINAEAPVMTTDATYEAKTTDIRGSEKYKNVVSSSGSDVDVQSKLSTQSNVRVQTVNEERGSENYSKGVNRLRISAKTPAMTRDTTYEAKTTENLGLETIKSSVSTLETNVDVQLNASTQSVKQRGSEKRLIGIKRFRITTETPVITTEATYKARTTDIRGLDKHSTRKYQGSVAEFETNVGVLSNGRVQSVTSRVPVAYEVKTIDTRGPAKYAAGEIQSSEKTIETNVNVQSNSDAQSYVNVQYDASTQSNENILTNTYAQSNTGRYYNTNTQSNIHIDHNADAQSNANGQYNVGAQTNTGDQYNTNALSDVNIENNAGPHANANAQYNVGAQSNLGKLYNTDAQSNVKIQYNTDVQSNASIQSVTSKEVKTADIPGSDKYSTEKYQGSVSTSETNVDAQLNGGVQLREPVTYEVKTTDVRGPVKYVNVQSNKNAQTYANVKYDTGVQTNADIQTNANAQFNTNAQFNINAQSNSNARSNATSQYNTGTQSNINIQYNAGVQSNTNALLNASEQYSTDAQSNVNMQYDADSKSNTGAQYNVDTQSNINVQYDAGAQSNSGEVKSVISTIPLTYEVKTTDTRGLEKNSSVKYQTSISTFETNVDVQSNSGAQYIASVRSDANKQSNSNGQIVSSTVPLSYELNATEIRGPAKYSSRTYKETDTSFQGNANGQEISSTRPTTYKIRTKVRRPTKFYGGYRSRVTDVESNTDVISTVQPTTYESDTSDIRGETKYSTGEYRDGVSRFESISTIQPTISTYEIKTRGPEKYWTGQYRSRTSSSLQTDADGISTVQPTTYQADTTDIRGSSRYRAGEYRGRVSEVQTNTDIPFVSTIQSYESETTDTRGPIRYSTVSAYADGTYNENKDSDVISNRISTTYTPEIINTRVPTRFTTAKAYRGSIVQTNTDVPSTVSTITEYSFDSTLGKTASKTSQTGYRGRITSETEISESTSGRTDFRQPTRLITGSYSGRGTRPTIASESIENLTLSGGSSDSSQERGAAKYYVSSDITDIREPAQFSSSLDLRGSSRFTGSETLTARTVRPGFLPQNTIDPILSGITINIGAEKGESTARYNSATDGSATTLSASDYESRKSSQSTGTNVVNSGNEISINIEESTATTSNPSTVKSARPTGFTPSLLNLGEISEERSSIKYQINQNSKSYQVNEKGPSTARYEENEKIPVPVIYAYSSSGSSSSQSSSQSSQEPSYFTREYLLESPVTKTYEEEYQYLSPVTIPSTTGRKSIRRKIYRKYNAQRPVVTAKTTTTTTEAPSPTTETSTLKQRRTTTIKPFQKLTVRRVPLQSVQKITLSKKELEEAKQKFKPAKDYDYYDDNHEKIAKYDGTKVILRGDGNIQCLDIGNFPHPTSCKKFISCARIESGAVLGWEYICPKGLSFDPVGGICNWSAGLGCNEKDI